MFVVVEPISSQITWKLIGMLLKVMRGLARDVSNADFRMHVMMVFGRRPSIYMTLLMVL